jgi:hypothetical protein
VNRSGGEGSANRETPAISGFWNPAAASVLQVASKKKLNKKGKAKIKAAVTFTPDGGEPSTESKKTKLVKR